MGAALRADHMGQARSGTGSAGPDGRAVATGRGAKTTSASVILGVVGSIENFHPSLSGHIVTGVSRLKHAGQLAITRLCRGSAPDPDVSAC